MMCPFCGHGLRTEQHGRVEIDRCPNCESLWFDEGELRAFREEQTLPSAPPPKAMPDLPLTCPRCNVASLQARRAEGIQARQCTQCRGIALERAGVVAVMRQRGAGSADAIDNARLGVEAADAAPDVFEAIAEVLSSILS